MVGGLVSNMEKGDILGHECIGEVVEAGRTIKNQKLETGKSSFSALRAVNAACAEWKFIRAAKEAAAMATCKRKTTDMHSAIPIPRADISAAGISTSEYHLEILGYSRFQIIFRMNRFCICRIFVQLDIWPPITVITKKVTQLLFRAAVRLLNLPSFRLFSFGRREGYYHRHCP